MNSRGSRSETAILSTPKAKRSYDELLSKGLKHTDLLLDLIGMAAFFLEKKPAKQLSASGKTPKTVAYFVVRLKSMATEVEKLNADVLYIPDKVEYMALPEMLLAYAEQLQARRRLLHRSRPGPMAQVLICIRDLVRRETGKENCALLKHLLAAATAESNFDFEAALKTNAHRYPAKIPRLHRLP